MKTSNKLLLTFLLSLMALFGAAHLALYAKFKQGHIISGIDRSPDWIVQFKGKTPSLVSVRGNINVRLIPSDTFFIEYTKEQNDKINCFPEGNDSLIIKGKEIAINPHEEFRTYSDFPWVTIHTGQNIHMRLSGVLAFVEGTPNPGKYNWDLKAINSQLWIGRIYDNPLQPLEYYDSIKVQADNSNLFLQNNTVIANLSVQLDERSEINDHNAKITRPVIRYTDQSRINLTGTNFTKSFIFSMDSQR